LFFALIAVGLPFAVTIGWALGETNLIKPPAAATPDGFGGIGTAPKPDKPVKRVGYPERTAGPRPASTTTPVTVRPWTADPSDPPSSAVPVEPTVPAPSVPPSKPAPSPSWSAHPSAEPSRLDAPGVIHRP
jgi:hypothetical protein